MSTALSVWKSAPTIIFPSRLIPANWWHESAPVLRRSRPADKDTQGAEVLRVGEIELDPGSRTVQQNGKPLELTSVEFNLLEVLLREAGNVVSRERLVDTVLGRKFSPFDRSIDMHVSKVRRKLGDTDGGADHIKTVRGVGYILTRPQEKRGSLQ